MNKRKPTGAEIMKAIGRIAEREGLPRVFRPSEITAETYAAFVPETPKELMDAIIGQCSGQIS